MTEIETLRNYIELKKKQIDDLLQRYGDSIRPGWVGEEIAFAEIYIERAERKLKQMEANNAD